MTLLLKQSTAAVVQFGPFVDATDGVTLETAVAAATLDHASTGIMISKNGGALAVRNGTPTASAYDAHGMYRITLNTTDTGTLGTLRMVFTDAATHLPVWADYMVMPANVWDSLFGADVLDVNVAQWLGTAAATPTTAGVPEVDVTHLNGVAGSAANLALSAAAIVSGAAEGTPSVSVIQTNLAETQDDIYNGRSVVFTSGDAAGEAREILDYVGATGTMTVVPLANAPAADDTLLVL